MIPILLAELVSAAPMTIQHQGRLLGTSGTPVDGATAIEVRLYDNSTGGTLLWTGTWSGVPVESGYYTVTLGASPSPALDTTMFDRPGVWVETTHAGITLPRQPLTSVPYAVEAERAQLTAKVLTTLPASNVGHSWVGTDLPVTSRLVSFTKRRSDTTLLLTWHDNMRCSPDNDSGESNCRIQIRFKRPADATWRDCGVPGTMVLDFYSNSRTTTGPRRSWAPAPS
jgi:hypothetical protein